MIFITKLVIKTDQMKSAIATYPQLPQLTESVLRIGPVVKIDDEKDSITILTIYDLSNSKGKETLIRDELTSRLSMVENLIPNIVESKIEDYKSLDEFLLPLVGQKI